MSRGCNNVTALNSIVMCKTVYSLLGALVMMGFLLLPANSAALDPEVLTSVDTIKIDEVTIKAPRSEVAMRGTLSSVTVITREMIEASGETNVFGIIGTRTPGLFITGRGMSGYGLSTGSAGHVSIRGVGGVSPNTQLLVLVDGVPQMASLFGHPLPDTHLSSDIERVEVVRGPSSVLFGSNAMAGAINLVTRNQVGEGLTGSGHVQFGTFGTRSYMGSLGARRGRLSVNASFNNGQTDGHRDSMNFNLSRGYLKARVQYQRIELGASFSVTGYEWNDPGSIFAPAKFGADVLRSSSSAWISNNFDRSRGMLVVYYNHGNHRFTDGWNSRDALSGITMHQTFSFFANNTLTLGSDFRNVAGKANRGANRDTWLYMHDVAAYAQVQQVIDIATLKGGFSLDNNSLHGTVWLPNAGIAVELPGQTVLKSSYARGFRSPTLMELYLFLPNINLQPERTSNFEIGVSRGLLDNRLSLEIVGFRIKGENMIEVVPNPFPPPPALRLNTGSFNNIGIEADISFTPNEGIHLIANYSYINTNQPRLSAPRHQFHAEAIYTFKNIRLRPNIQHLSGLYTRVGQSPVKEAFTLLNMQLSYRPFQNIDLLISARNLLDQSYSTIYGYPMPGTNLTFGINWKLD